MSAEAVPAFSSSLFSSGADAHATLSATLWHLLTRLGEAQILLPLAAVAAAWLWLAAGQRRLVLRWALAIATAGGLTTASKLAFMGWGLGSARWDFTGISGHAMFAAVCLPVLAWVALAVGGAEDRRGLRRKLALVAGYMLAALVAWSRIEVGAHSHSESAAGFALGGLASAWALAGAPRLRQMLPLWLPAGLAAALLLLPFSAPRSRSHELMMEISRQISGRDRLYTRRDLHRRGSGQPPAALSAAGRLPGTTGSGSVHPAPR